MPSRTTATGGLQRLIKPEEHMRHASHTVCMTVTHPTFGQRNQPLLSDACLDLAGTSPEYLYGIHGEPRDEYRQAISAKHDLISANSYVEMTFTVPGDMRAPLRPTSGQALQVFDFKKCFAEQRNVFIDLYCEFLKRCYDVKTVAKRVGDLAYSSDCLGRLTTAYPELLPQVMRATDLKIAVVMMAASDGSTTPIAVIAREHIQTYVKDIKTRILGRAFAYRIQDGGGLARHIDLPPMAGTLIAPRRSRKGIYDRMTPTVEAVICTNTSRPGNVIELDRFTIQAIGSTSTWSAFHTDHRYVQPDPQAPHFPYRDTDEPTWDSVPTKTLLVLSSSTETWPDCSQIARLDSIVFFHPDLVSAATLRAFITRLIDELAMHGVYPTQPGGDDRRIFDQLVMDEPLHAIGVLESTGIDVAVLPKRNADRTVVTMTLIREGRIARYLRSIDTVGVDGPVLYVMNFEKSDRGPNWIEVCPPLPRAQARPIAWTPEEEAECADMTDDRNLVGES